MQFDYPNGLIFFAVGLFESGFSQGLLPLFDKSFNL